MEKQKIFVQALTSTDMVNELMFNEDTILITTKEVDQNSFREYVIANSLKEIAAESPEYGNTLMDLLGKECYYKIMEIAKRYGEYSKESE